MLSSTDCCMESGWILVGVQGPRTAIKLINLALDNRKDEVCTSAHKINIIINNIHDLIFITINEASLNNHDN